MAAHLKDEKERDRRIKLVGDYFLQTGKSTREISKYFTENYFDISNKTVSVYIKEYLNKYKEKANEIMELIDNNKSKSIEDEEVVDRVFNTADLILSGKSLEETAKILNVSYKTCERDISYRLKALADRSQPLREYYILVKDKLYSNQVEELNKGRKK